MVAETKAAGLRWLGRIMLAVGWANCASATPGAPLVNLAPLAYDASAPISPGGPGVSYYMEGIKPGPITLEFHWQRGDIDVTETRNFLVCTQQSKADWQEEIRQLILLQSGVNMAGYVKTKTFVDNYDYIQQVYAFYQQINQSDPAILQWAGLAKLAGGPVYAGMSDAQWGMELPGNVASWLPPPYNVPGELGALAVVGLMLWSHSLLIEANINIWEDLAWQFHAYHCSGVWALRYNDTDPFVLAPSLLRRFEFLLWKDLWQGEYSSIPATLLAANLAATRREQEWIVQPAWNRHVEVPRSWAAFSLLTENPITGGASFTASLGTGADVTKFADRWAWINSDIWPNWIALGIPEQTTNVVVLLRARATGYSKVTAVLRYPVK